MDKPNVSRRQFLSTIGKTGLATGLIALTPVAAFGQANGQATHIKPITMRYDRMNVFDHTTGKPIELPQGTKIQFPIISRRLPSNQAIIYCNEHGQSLTGRLGANGQKDSPIGLPPGTQFVLPNGQIQKYPNAMIQADQKGIDFLHAVSGIEGYKGDKSGVVFTVDADSAFPHIPQGNQQFWVEAGTTSNKFNAAKQLQVAYTLAFYAQYDLIYDLDPDKMSKEMISTYTAYHRNEQPMKENDANNKKAFDEFINHLATGHNVPPDVLNLGYRMAHFIVNRRTPEQHSAEPDFVPVVDKR